MMGNKFKRLLDDIEYPDNEQLLTGPSNGYNYIYVSTTYLNGFINYVKPICAYMICRYSIGNQEEWNTMCENVNMLKDGFHTNIEDSSKFDDVIILAESEYSYWVFWDDCDCSDSCIGKFKKSDFYDNDGVDIELLKDEFKKYVIDCLENSTGYKFVPDEYDKYIKYIPGEYFHGWITL